MVKTLMFDNFWSTRKYVRSVSRCDDYKRVGKWVLVVVFLGGGEVTEWFGGFNFFFFFG